MDIVKLRFLFIISSYFPILAKVNISLVEFQDGILSVPENQEQGQIQVDLTEAVNSEPVSFTLSCL